MTFPPIVFIRAHSKQTHLDKKNNLRNLHIKQCSFCMHNFNIDKIQILNYDYSITCRWTIVFSKFVLLELVC